MKKEIKVRTNIMIDPALKKAGHVEAARRSKPKATVSFSELLAIGLKKELNESYQELIELNEKLRDQIINAFRAGRKAGAIFKTQRDAEGLAERYLRDLTIKK